MPPDELTLEAALEMLDKSTQGEEPLGHCPKRKTSTSRWGDSDPTSSAEAPTTKETPERIAAQGDGAGEIDLEAALNC